MRQNAVSSAPQNEEPIHTLAISAAIPMPPESFRTRSSTFRSVDSAVRGKIRSRSIRTLFWNSWLLRTWPPMNSASSARGSTDSSRL